MQPRFCMEVGCGSGYVITSLATMLRHESSAVQYFATDINPHAVETTSATLEAHGLQAEIICTDIASGIGKRLSGMMDVIVVNPPYVPTQRKKLVIKELLPPGQEVRMVER
ncbi:hypothetical protein KSP39_PZI022047 [Platanthera zijinensis]|uniref:Methyltransferase small domain-containing protein n=1 Tax=Platanthera zijinensis TaxID=2320716 RepID=A0AAP0AY08_9ASPA